MKPQWVFIDDADTKTVHYIRLDLIVRIEDVLTQPRRATITMKDGFTINLEGESTGSFMETFRQWARGLT